MILPETFQVARLLSAEAVRYWIFGGNGVELVLGEDIRPHDDVDVFIAADDAGRAVDLLLAEGWAHHVGSLESGDIFLQRNGVLLDIVPIDDQVDPPRTLGKLAAIELPAGMLQSHAVATDGGDPVITLAPAMHLAMKDSVGRFYGEPPRAKDLLDIRALKRHVEASVD